MYLASLEIQAHLLIQIRNHRSRHLTLHRLPQFAGMYFTHFSSNVGAAD